MTDTSFEERTGEAFEFAERLTVVGRKLQPGEAAPDFRLESFDADAGAMQSITLGDSAGTVRTSLVWTLLAGPAELLPLHWNASGQADDWGTRGTVGGCSSARATVAG